MAGVVSRSAMPPAAQAFAAERTQLYVASREAAERGGTVWASVLRGAAGFIHADTASSLQVSAALGDQLSRHVVERPGVGLLLIDHATRRRMRVNGRASLTPEGMQVQVEQAYANCPQYIQHKPDWPVAMPSESQVEETDALGSLDAELIAGANTFFIASAHDEAGLDLSHRGGHAGFVRVQGERTLRWDDFAGNQFFQTLGNIAVQPQAGLLFEEAATGSVLQLSGRAQIEWQGQERSVLFTVEHVRASRVASL